MTAAVPALPVTVEETLAQGADGSTVVLVSFDGGRSQVFQYRRDGRVLAEAPTLRMLAHRIAEDS